MGDEPPGIYDLCYPYYEAATILQIISITSAVVITFVNIFMKVIFKKLGAFRRYKTLSQEAKSVMITIFLATVMNTIVIPYALMARYRDTIPATIITQPIPFLNTMQPQEREHYVGDLNRKWYMDVGGKITNTFIIMTFSPHIITWLLLPLYRCMKVRKAHKSLI